MKVLALVLFGSAIIWSVVRIVAANHMLRRIGTGAQRRHQPDAERDAYRRGAAAVLADLVALERITTAQAEAWGALPIEQVEEQLLMRGAITREQWDQLWTRHMLPALKQAELPTVTLDAELQGLLRRQNQER